jgi:hypothetical protein
VLFVSEGPSGEAITMKRCFRAFSPADCRCMLTCSSCLIALLAICAGVTVRASDLPFRMTASSETLGIAAGIGRDVEITITRWSTESEREALVAAFLNQGPWRLLGLLRNTPQLGRIKAPRVTGCYLRFAARDPLPNGGQRLILMTDRPMSPWITWTQVPVSDYPFALIELHLNPTGGGVGKLSLATTVAYDDEHRIVALEHYAGAPVWLQDVRVEPD